MPSGEKLFQFRRGTYPTRIFSISFDISNSFLAVSSESDTIHVFKLSQTTEKSVSSNSLPSLKKPGMIESLYFKSLILEHLQL